MTFTLNATVAEVTADVEDESNTAVLIQAFDGDTVESYGTTMQAVYSNTEGKILSAKIVLVIEGSAPPLAVGDMVPIHGHFTAPKV